jgi:hypothetical protein
MKKPITVLARLRSEEPVDLPLEPIDRRVHISPTITGTVHAIIGIATSDVDVVVTDDYYEPRHPRDECIAEISKKHGKYDGRERDRVLLRRLPGHQTGELTTATLDVLRTDDGRALVVATDTEGDTLWSGVYRRWTHELTDAEHAGDIVLWHWRRYYSFLSEVEVRSLAKGFPTEAAGLNLAQANRLASRRLYALAREAGWRKLTLREQTKWGLGGQWHREAEIASARGLSASGCGERTILSATMAEHLEGWVGR